MKRGDWQGGRSRSTRPKPTPPPPLTSLASPHAPSSLVIVGELRSPPLKIQCILDILTMKGIFLNNVTSDIGRLHCLDFPFSSPRWIAWPSSESPIPHTNHRA